MVSKEGIVMWQDAEGVALDGWMKVVSTSLIGLEITQTRFFRLVKHPTQLFYYTSEKTSKPRGKVELKSSDGEPLPITIENNVLVMKSSTMRILCDSADEATMWGLAIKGQSKICGIPHRHLHIPSSFSPLSPFLLSPSLLYDIIVSERGCSNARGKE
mmetsp:Transcript_34764/g.55909  ORF Transcript_34764/g.55909 Transcript_34764/m.55909 type:complete len:158 (-) Transcript_34764:556-1029(-)